MSKWRITQVACKTSGAPTTQSITISGFGTPKAAIFIVGGSTVNGTIDANTGFSVGTTDGTNEYAGGYADTDNVGTSDAGRGGRSNRVIILPNADTTTNGEAHFSQWVTDGVEIDWDDYPSSAFLMQVILIGGDDVTCDVSLNTYDQADDTEKSFNIGFRPTVLFSFRHGGSWTGNSVHAAMTMGFATDTSPIKQNCVTVLDIDNVGTSLLTGGIFDDYLEVGSINSTTPGVGSECTSFSATGYGITKRNGSGTISSVVLAVKMNDSAFADDYSAPTSTGNQAITGVGFEPQFVFLLTSLSETIDTMYDTDLASGISQGAFDDTNQYSHSTSIEDGVSTMNVNNVDDDDPVHVLLHDGTSLFTSSGTPTMDSDGFTINYANVDEANTKIFAYLAIAKPKSLLPYSHTARNTLLRM